MLAHKVPEKGSPDLKKPDMTNIFSSHATKLHEKNLQHLTVLSELED
jgi:hypothetical protein